LCGWSRSGLVFELRHQLHLARVRGFNESMSQVIVDRFPQPRHEYWQWLGPAPEQQGVGFTSISLGIVACGVEFARPPDALDASQLLEPCDSWPLGPGI